MRNQSQLAHFMRVWEDHQRRTLERYYPDWNIWTIRGIGPTAWCASKKGGHLAEIVTQSPEHLVRLIVESQFPGSGSA